MAMKKSASHPCSTSARAQLSGASAVKTMHAPLHGDYFLHRHLPDQNPDDDF
jgi:hypothetical protein